MELAFEQQRLTSLRRTAHPVLAQDQTQEIIIPDSMPDAARTLICYAEPELQSKTVRAGSLLVTGTLRTSCLYAAEDGSVQLLTAELPFAVKPESPELTEAAQTAAAACAAHLENALVQRELMQLFQKYKGDDCVYLQLMGSRKLIKTTPNFWVNSEAPGFAEDVVKILGENCVVKKG